MLTVSQLTRLIRGAIQKELPGDLHVLGELSNVSQPESGHLYFTLKDESSEVRCVMWQASAKTLRFSPVDGLQVVATGSVDVYEPRGQYQLYVKRLEPRGVGELELAFRQLKERLEKEGLFDPRRKRKLPKFPGRIAVVTSTTGAAIRDILRTIARRYPAVLVYVFGVRVQGEGAAAEIADAIRRINLAREKLGGIDVMIVGRGGGSLEDLWAFNEEVVARAIHASEIPVVSAVGHEVDFTIADFVADVRAATPTAAAELAVPARDELLEVVDAQRHRLGQAARRLLESARARLAVVERCEWFRDPIGRVRQRQQAVDEMVSRLRLVVARTLSARRTTLHEGELRLLRVRPEAVLAGLRERIAKMQDGLRWAQGRFALYAERRLRDMSVRLVAASPRRQIEHAAAVMAQLDERVRHGWQRLAEDRRRALVGFEARLSACSHEQVLRRGFTITRKARDGTIVSKPDHVKTGDRIETETAAGKIASRVLDGDQGELFE
ncbi:MAG TPA: exodeoxyribonuclease VII large subunit [Phycisphaerae bacterium]|nr:exodeoxyribonuclease VII large subunit [Phycisphaerae bacterium]